MAQVRETAMGDHRREQEPVARSGHHPKPCQPLEVRLARLRELAGILRLEGGPAPSRKFLGTRFQSEHEPAERACD
ncbi:MAG: hypothetical protein HY690_18225 [Chloroflexi bacterium]|nr:hypothetical protein [Chloroflexota bacterium]